MKLFLSSILVISFTLLAVFSAFAMTYGGSRASGCIAAIAQGFDCPEAASPISHASFYLDAFLNFSRAVFTQGILSMLLFIVGLSALVLLRFTEHNFAHIPRSGGYSGHRHISRLSVSPQRLQLTHWLALHENSPAIS